MQNDTDRPPVPPPSPEDVLAGETEGASERSPSVSIGVPREIIGGERRVALIPDTVTRLAAAGVTVLIEAGAGAGAYVDDASYMAAGAAIVPDARTLYARSQIVAKVQPPTAEEATLLQPGTILLSLLDRVRNADIVSVLAARDVTAFSFNAVPRITRAQSMDVMSSMSTVAGYRAALLGAGALGRFFPLLMTAAGTLAPARVLVVGAGVAGLQALATARRLGAVTEAFDTRPEVREQVQSVGASFVELPVEEETSGEGGYAREMSEDFYGRERLALRDPVAHADVVITTALVPGKRAPLLIDEPMVADMRSGSVIVDLSGEAGGNCELSIPGETVVRHGVTILAPLNLASTLPVHASQMYSRNVASALTLFVKEGRLDLDPDDEIVRSACITMSRTVAP